MQVDEGVGVMITTGELVSFYGHVVSIKRYEDKPVKALVETLDWDNKETRRWYNVDNLLVI